MNTTTPPVVIVTKGPASAPMGLTVTRHRRDCGIARRTADRNDARAELHGKVDERLWVAEGNYPLPKNHTCIPCPHYERKEQGEFARRPTEDAEDCGECYAAGFICPCCGLCTDAMVMTTKCCLLCHPTNSGFIRQTINSIGCPAHLVG